MSPALVLALLACGQPPAEKKADRIAQTVIPRYQEFDDLAPVFKIQKKAARVALKVPAKAVGAEIVMYRDGKKLDRTVRFGGLSGLENVDLPGKEQVDFSLHVVDTDYVPLGDAKKNHCRLMVNLRVVGTIGDGGQDVPKDVFDFSRTWSGGYFRAEVGEGDRVPVCWMLGRTNAVRARTGVADLIAANAQGDLAIVYLVVER